MTFLKIFAACLGWLAGTVGSYSTVVDIPGQSYNFTANLPVTYPCTASQTTLIGCTNFTSSQINTQIKFSSVTFQFVELVSKTGGNITVPLPTITVPEIVSTSVSRVTGLVDVTELHSVTATKIWPTITFTVTEVREVVEFVDCPQPVFDWYHYWPPAYDPNFLKSYPEKPSKKKNTKIEIEVNEEDDEDEDS